MHSLKTGLQALSFERIITAFFGRLAQCRTVWLKNWMIRTFIRRYQVDLRIAQCEKATDYPTFNDFFIRKLKTAARPIAGHSDDVACPVDGTISQIGFIQDNRLFQAKGFDFSLLALLGNAVQVAQLFHQGLFATFYLAPKDYHRIHMPIDGRLQKTIFIPGRLFSVNKQNTQQIPQLFARNERAVCLFDTPIGPMAMILVGAVIVGSINTVWQPDAYRHPNVTEQAFSNEVFLKKGDELGYFKLGSTVITLFPAHAIRWLEHLAADSSVVMGQRIGRFI